MSKKHYLRSSEHDEFTNFWVPPKGFTGYYEYPNKTKEYRKDGKLHREDGPAVEMPRGSKYWYLNGVEYSEENWQKEVAKLKGERLMEIFVRNNDLNSIPSGFSGVAVWPSGTLVWYLKGKIHCEDGPAWERVDGYKAWFVDGKRHRKDGPAIVYPNGNEFWYLNGKEYSKADWQAEVSPQPKEGN
jgi:hypothetical protein